MTTNALKETLAKGNDRDTASPTESAVSGSWHKGTLWSRLSERRNMLIRAVRGRALRAREDKSFFFGECLVNAGGTADILLKEKIIRPEIHFMYFGTVFYRIGKFVLYDKTLRVDAHSREGEIVASDRARRENVPLAHSLFNIRRQE